MMPIKDSKIIFCSQFTLFNSVNKSMVIPRNLFYNLAHSSVIYIILSLNPPPVANSVKNNTEMPQQNGVSKLTPVSETISADLLLFLGFVSHAATYTVIYYDGIYEPRLKSEISIKRGVNGSKWGRRDVSAHRCRKQ